MSISVQLHLGIGHVSERGGSGGVFPVPDDDQRFPYLRLVDPYDVTHFNSNQMGALVPELVRMKESPMDAEAQAILDNVIRMAMMCRDTIGAYLVFVGD